MPIPKLSVFALLLLPLSAAAAPPAPPRDVPPGHFAAPAVKRITHENIMGTAKDGRFQGDQAVTRYELAVALDHFVRYIEAGRKPLHAQSFPAPKRLPPAASAAQRQALNTLIGSGFLPLNTPLSQDNRPVTAKETSDALASVTIRLSDRAEPPHKF